MQKSWCDEGCRGHEAPRLGAPGVTILLTMSSYAELPLGCVSRGDGHDTLLKDCSHAESIPSPREDRFDFASLQYFD